MWLNNSAYACSSKDIIDSYLKDLISIIHPKKTQKKKKMRQSPCHLIVYNFPTSYDRRRTLQVFNKNTTENRSKKKEYYTALSYIYIYIYIYIVIHGQTCFVLS